ncbi:transmembrane protein, putative (macronuclear) [Tetrahymena thermophila SB210]|uniref:Transmembrane protein, putative n=1 Tax=Tetrahymena thermophila (strain SB210) TaxID=312017 RepID=W7XB00_TETTS|nr:transmembrane protein, putative [Tetrahymena thermophila SB210]EWS76550.1 transmembrane protein, putative [Tetrahymena thermophila SB210]|eukprot:XP_012650922.1 transmembrane protein, putative [Tetrahymena thermophila SB210]
MENSYLIMIQNTFIVLNQINYQNNQGSFQLSQQQTISIQSSNFSFNQAQNGGALSFIGIQQSVSFIQSQFIGNYATSSGGALFLADIGNCQIIFDQNSKVSKNKALIGGGLRIIQSNSLNLQFPKNFPFKKNIFQNEAEIYGNDSTTYPQQLQLQNVQGQNKQNMYQFNFQESKNFIPQAYQSQFSRYAHIKDFQSGGQLILRIFVLDNYNRTLSFSQEKLLGEQYPSDIQQELKDIYISINNLDVQLSQLIGQRILDYNQYNSTSYAFELTSLQVLAGLQSTQLFVISSSIYTKSEESYPVLLSIYFRQCQLGEIIQSVTNDILICKYCQEQTYSLIDPQVLFKQQLDQSNLIKNECNMCPPSASSCQGASINLKNGYWRSNNFTDQILPCDPQIGSCKGEDPNSINYCSNGYIGPLCQQCDITGEIWQGVRYQEAIMKGFCEKCAGIYFQYAFLFIKFSIMILYFFLSMFVFLKQFRFTQACYYLRILKILPIYKNSINDYSGFQIKIIINFYQLSSILFPNSQFIPIYLSFLNNFIGQTNRQLSLGLDCVMHTKLIEQFATVKQNLTIIL